MISTAAKEHPELVFDYAVAHEKAVLDLVEASSRWAFIPELADTSADPALARQVRAYADRSVPKGAQQEAERVIADIMFQAEVRARQRPAVEAWMTRLDASLLSS